MPSKRKQKEHLFKLGINILLEEKEYSQKVILEKINSSNIDLSSASLNNLITGRRRVGDRALGNAVLGLEKILDQEFGLKYDLKESVFKYSKPTNWQPELIKTSFEQEDWDKNEIVFKKGRFGIEEKIKLYNTSKKEIVEIGVRLQTFCNYFTEEGDEYFKDHIIKILNNGVNFHCYILNNKGRYAVPYFQDRAKELKEESTTVESISLSRQKLVKIFRELNKKSQTGKMHLYIYNTNPSFHTKAVDGNFHPRDQSPATRFTKEGLIYITQYLFGIPRSKSPSFILNKKINKDIYKTYWTSIDKILNHAKKVDLNMEYNEMIENE